MTTGGTATADTVGIHTWLPGMFNVHDFHAMGDGTTDDTPAIQAAIDAAANGVTTTSDPISSRSGRVVFPSGMYNVTRELVVRARGITLEGIGNEGSIVSLITPGARITYTGGGLGWSLMLRNLQVYGNLVAKIGVRIAEAEECVIMHTSIRGCVDTQLESTGGHIMRLIDARLGDAFGGHATSLIRLTSTAALSMVACNLFQLPGTTAAILASGDILTCSFAGSWAEGFQNFLLVDNADGRTVVTNFNASGSHFVSTRPQARVVKVQSSRAGDVACRAIPVSFRDGTWFLTNTDFAVEVGLTGNTDGNSGLNLLLDNVTVPIPPSVALVSSDVPSTRVVVQHMVGLPPTGYLDGPGSVMGAGANGQFGFGASMQVIGGRLTWPAVQVPSADTNTLDDYKKFIEWTPRIGGEGGTSGQTYGRTFGYAVKDGPRVTVWFSCFLTAKGTITGNVVISGLPYPSHAVGIISIGAIRFGQLATNWVNIVGVTKARSTDLYLTGTQAAGTANDRPLTAADISDSTQIVGTLTYLAEA